MFSAPSTARFVTDPLFPVFYFILFLFFILLVCSSLQLKSLILVRFPFDKIDCLIFINYYVIQTFLIMFVSKYVYNL